jgi:hypothetical protein
VQSLGAIARTLAGGYIDDKQLALKIVEFVRAMPTTATRHDALVRAIRARKNKEAELQRGVDREAGRDAGTEPVKDRTPICSDSGFKLAMLAFDAFSGAD